MSVKHHQKHKPSWSWVAPFALGLIAGVAITLLLSEGFLGAPDESDTVANAALEAAPRQANAEPVAEPPVGVAVRQPEPPSTPPQPTAAEPPAAAPEAPPPAASASPSPLAAALEAEKETSAPKPAAPRPSVAAVREPAPPEPVVVDRAALAARAPLPGTSQPPPLKPIAPAPVVVYQDPNSEDAKLAAAAQVRVKGDTKIDNMLDQALTGEKQAPPTAAPATPVLVQTPTRDDVVNTMSVLVPAIRGCAQGQSGLAPMSIVVLSDGRVESAALSSGPFQGTASGRCMEGVVRRARFPHFKQANFRVQFPFAVQ